MTTFSGTQAVGAGFRLIRREPVAFLAWTATYIVICLLPQIGMMSVMLPEWARMAQEIQLAGTQPGSFPHADVFQAQARMLQLQPLALLSSLVGHTLMMGAVYRAVLFPDDRRFLYLRLSARELWLGLAILVLFVLIAIVAAGMAVLVAALGGIIALSTQAPAGLALIAPLVFFLIFGVIVWLALRLSLAPPMSFSAPGFRLYESWSVTRGHGGKLFLVALAFAVMAWVAELVILAVCMGALGGFAGLSALSGWVTHPHFDLGALAPSLVIGGLVLGLFTTAFTTLVSAGWAEIYRELSAEPQV